MIDKTGQKPSPSYSNAQNNSDLLLLWTETWNQAVALSWRDPDFREALISNPKKALKETFGFVFQEAIDFKVAPVDPADDRYGWTPGAIGPDGWSLPPTEVTLYLPAAPEASEQAVAVMAYWFTSEQLPFSTACC